MSTSASSGVVKGRAGAAFRRTRAPAARAFCGHGEVHILGHLVLQDKVGGAGRDGDAVGVEIQIGCRDDDRAIAACRVLDRHRHARRAGVALKKRGVDPGLGKRVEQGATEAVGPDPARHGDSCAEAGGRDRLVAALAAERVADPLPRHRLVQPRQVRGGHDDIEMEGTADEDHGFSLG